MILSMRQSRSLMRQPTPERHNSIQSFPIQGSTWNHSNNPNCTGNLLSRVSTTEEVNNDIYNGRCATFILAA